jgi:hypothetical protein
VLNILFSLVLTVIIPSPGLHSRSTSVLVSGLTWTKVSLVE